jgi:hypothetical protein
MQQVMIVVTIDFSDYLFLFYFLHVAALGEELVDMIRTVDLKVFAVLHEQREMRRTLPVLEGNFTPSNAAKSENRARARDYLASLFSIQSPDLKVFAVPDSKEKSTFPPFTFRFKSPKYEEEELRDIKEIEREIERESYGPFCDFLHSQGLNAHIISEGQYCLDGRLFFSDVFTLRNKTYYEENEFKARQNLRYQFKASGRSDLVVLQDGINCNLGINKFVCKYCIEVKTVVAMDTEGKENASLREAAFQLIGVNASNDQCTPSVILTNLSGKHYVLSIHHPEIVGSIQKHQYLLEIRRFGNVGWAVEYAELLSARPCISADFGRPPTPFSSVHENEGDASEQELDELFENVAIFDGNDGNH